MADKIAIDFERFHRENPRVYRLFDKCMHDMMSRGYERGSAYLAAEIIRWETSVETTGEAVKINNNYRPMYARLWMNRNPEHSGFLRTRARRKDTVNSVRIDPDLVDLV